jgi:hypothetical protein
MGLSGKYPPPELDMLNITKFMFSEIIDIFYVQDMANVWIKCVFSF